MIDQNGYVKHKITDHSAEIEFYHPKGNSLPGYLLNELSQTVEDLAKNNDINVIILTSKGGGAFCGGASFDELVNIQNESDGKKFFMGFANVINSMRKCPKLIIGRVQGKVVGGGVGLVSACDYAIAVKDASVKLSELALGIGPFVIEPAVVKKIGRSAFTSLTINYDWRDAEWALEKGLFDEVCENIDRLNESVEKQRARMADSNPEAISELKKIFWSETENWDELLERRAEISGKLVLSEHTRKYIEAFKSK